MFWSAALDLKTQRLPTRPSYGSFHRFHIPQSIPEHQPLSQFTSPVPTDARRIDEYFERPDTAHARSQASLQLSEHTQTALKMLLQGERDAKSKSSKASSKVADMSNLSRISNFNRQITPEKEPLEQSPLLKSVTFTQDQEEPNPQESSNEHNYWMQELERRRAGLKRSRRLRCTPLSERATTSPFKVGVIMCSVPLVLVLGFVLYALLLGDASGVSSNLMNNLLGFGDRDTDSFAARHRITRTFADLPENTQLREESPVLSLNVPTGQTRLRSSQE